MLGLSGGKQKRVGGFSHHRTARGHDGVGTLTGASLNARLTKHVDRLCPPLHACKVKEKRGTIKPAPFRDRRLFGPDPPLNDHEGRGRRAPKSAPDAAATVLAPLRGPGARQGNSTVRDGDQPRR